MSHSQTTHLAKTLGWSLKGFWTRFRNDPSVWRGTGVILVTTVLALGSGRLFGLFLPFPIGFPDSFRGLAALVAYGPLIPLVASLVFYAYIGMIRRIHVDIFDLIPRQYLARIPIIIPAIVLLLNQDSRYLYRLENPLPHPMTFALFLEILRTQPLHLIHPAGSAWYDVFVLLLVKPAAIAMGALWSAKLMYQNFREVAQMPHEGRTLCVFLPALLLIGCITYSAMALMDATLFAHAAP